MKTYLELITLKSFDERLEYLLIRGDNPGNEDRAVTEKFYKSKIWRKIRDSVISRDLGFDLGVVGVNIDDEIIVHHINPITTEDILTGSELCYDMNNLITVSLKTHNRIHFLRDDDYEYVERKPGDTLLW